MQCAFTTGGDSSFSGTTISRYYYDGDALSGNIDDDQESWMQTTYSASAGDKVSFFWKVSSEDDLKFYIDDSLQNTISGEEDWEKKSYALSAGSRTLKWVYEKDSSDYEGDDAGWIDGLYVGPSSGSLPPDPEGPGAYAEAVDSSLKFTSSGDSTWSAVSGTSWENYVDVDSAQSYNTLGVSEESILQTIVDSASSETLKFWWKVSSNENDDYLEFYIDDTRQDRISGEVDWTQKEYTVSAGIHTLKWRYVRSNEDDEGDNCGWVDFVQWTGASPVPDSDNWQQLDYKHDVYGRRSEKLIDGYATRYVYDGPHVIAEYDGNNNLLRKFIYGPGIDQAVSMIEVADSNAAYYYHYDALGSVIALSDSSGDTVQTYEYSVYGEVYVEDADHTNPYMFAGRRYDIEIGLYYNRARYYNPYTGRFLQTDPAGDGMNLYAYCGNSPIGRVDPSGLYWTFLDDGYVHLNFGREYWGKLVFAWVDNNDSSVGDGGQPGSVANVEILKTFSKLDDWYEWAADEYFNEKEGRKGHAEGWVPEEQIGYSLSQTWTGPSTFTQDDFFWRVQAMRYLSGDVAVLINQVEGLMGSNNGRSLQVEYYKDDWYRNTNYANIDPKTDVVTVSWNSRWNRKDGNGAVIPNLVTLTHELQHAKVLLEVGSLSAYRPDRENPAIKMENRMRAAFYWKVPRNKKLMQRGLFKN